jgi:molybdenum cofactor guanylyltransferase
VATRSGLVLAGGASRRMGRDKALLVVDGERLVDRAVRRLQEVAEDVVVASGTRTIPGLRVAQVGDRLPGCGPLGGLVAGLEAVAGDLALVLACDLPDADTALLGQLADRWQGDAALIPSARGRPQPLHAVWSAAAAVQLGALVDAGVRPVLDAADRLGARVLDDDETAALHPAPRWWRNLNTP